jgi:hypothetical protein
MRIIWQSYKFEIMLNDRVDIKKLGLSKLKRGLMLYGERGDLDMLPQLHHYSPGGER